MARQFKSQINILVADDDEDDCLLVGEALKEALPSVSSRCVEDGELLWDYLQHCKPQGNGAGNPCPDLILLDLNMPRMDGREVLKRIKGDERFKCIPVVILSTSNERDDIAFTYRFGANSYLKKPLSFEELVRLMAVLGAFWFNAAELPPHDLPPSYDLSVIPKLKTTVFVVDDSSFARKVLNRILRTAGHKVIEADDGETALNLYRTEKPDLVLLDIALPDLSGRELLEKLLEIDPQVKIIITTADVSQITGEEMIGRGAVGLLYKPFGSEATLYSVDSALKKAPSDTTGKS